MALKFEDIINKLDDNDKANADALTSEEERAKTAEQTNSDSIAAVQNSITELGNEKQNSIASMLSQQTDASKLGDLLVQLAGNKAAAANLLAKYVVENYSGSTLAGKAQSVKAAADSMNDSIANALDAVTNEEERATAAEQTKQDITPTEAVTDPADHALQLVGNAQIDYATLANAIIAKLKSEDVVQAQTNNANKLISAALAYSMNQSILQLEDAVAEYRLMIDPETGHMALAHYTKEA